MRKLTVVVGLLLTVLFAPMAYAWNATGHMVIAALAYRQLSPATRQKLDAVLQRHPSYPTWQQEWNQSPGVSLELYAFMAAASWPDYIRGDDKTNPYNRPRWHYVNYPLRPPDFPLQPRPDPEDDVVFAIEQAEGAVAAEATLPEDRAAWLSWLEHAIGDIHQPEHCVAYFGYPFQAEGDRGGNLFFVKSTGKKPIALHALWDGLLGWSQKLEDVFNCVSELEQDPLLTRGELKEPNDSSGISALAWSEQTREVAVEFVYLRGELRGTPPAGQNPQTGRSVPPAMAYPLPDGYEANAAGVAGRCVMLAGYRLHDRLERLLR